MLKKMFVVLSERNYKILTLCNFVHGCAIRNIIEKKSLYVWNFGNVKATLH